MAQVKISQLPTASDLGSSDALPIVQGGVTKKLSGASMASFVEDRFIVLIDKLLQLA